MRIRVNEKIAATAEQAASAVVEIISCDSVQRRKKLVLALLGAAIANGPVPLRALRFAPPR